MSGIFKIKFKQFMVNCILMILVVIILLVIGETGANVMIKLGKGKRHQIMGTADNIVMNSPNKELEFVFKPYYVNSEGDTITNALGFHEYDWEQSQLDQSRVILNIGDSITFGAQIKEIDHVYGKVLQRLLQQNFPDDQYIVYNAGVGGYNIWQERALLKELTGKIPYQAVLLGFCLNDSSPKMYVSKDIKGAVVNVAGEIEKAEEIFSRKFLNRFKLYVMFKEAVKSLQRRYPNLFPSSMLWYNMLVKSEGWNNLKQTLLEMHNELIQRNIPLIVVIFPYAHQLRLDAKNNTIQNDLMQFCLEHDISCLDLFTEYQKNQQAIRWDEEGIHPDVNGHRIAGEAIYQYLIHQKLIPIQHNQEVINEQISNCQ